MNDDDAEPTAGEHISCNLENHTLEKTCAEPMEDDTSNEKSVFVDLNQSKDSAIEINAHNRTDSSLNSTVNSKPSTSGKSKRRSGGKKHRAGRNQKRKWKPYHKLTWEEQKRLDERNARRAQRIRDEMTAHGLPCAPYNTSQFLINDYLSCHPHCKYISDKSIETDSNHSEEPEDPSEEHFYISSKHCAFYEQSFLEDYEHVHQEYLNNLTNYDLADQYVNLEDEIEHVDKQLKDLQEKKKQMEVDTPHPDAEMEKIEVFRIEIEKLFQENKDLEAQNEKLRQILNTDSQEF